MTQVETEPRAPESKQSSVSEQCAECKPERPAGNEPLRFMTGMTDDTLARLQKLAPDEMDKIDNAMADDQCAFFNLITRGVAGDWTKLPDVLEFVQNWTPDSSAERQSTAADTGAVNKQLRIAQCMAGQRVTANHWFTQWAATIRNVLPMLQAITGFGDLDQRETKYDDQDTCAVGGIANFIEKELEALAEHLDRAGDVSDPKIIAPNGFVWRLKAEAVLVQKPETAKGGTT